MFAQMGRRAVGVSVSIVAVLLVVVAMMVPIAQRANAWPCVLGVPCVVTNQAQFADALAFYGTNAAGPEVISIGNDFGYTTNSSALYPAFHSVTIEGNGHRIWRETTDDVMFLQAIATPPSYDQAVTINDLTIEGFQSNLGALYTTTDLFLGNVSFIDNVNTSVAGGAVQAERDATIVDSYFEGNYAVVSGGAVYTSGALVVDSSDFIGNATSGQGGAIYSAGTLSVANTYFWENSSFLYGGAIRGVGMVTVDNSEFYDNTSRYGGAIFAQGGVDVDDSTFADNIANSSNSDETGQGGAIYANGSLTIDDSAFYDNSAGTNYYGSGGALVSISGGQINGSWFEGNVAGDSAVGGFGGAIYTMTSSLLVGDSQFIGNVAGPGTGMNGSGGAISTIDTQITIEGSTFTGNRAGGGGGAIDTQSLLVIENSTLVANSARAFGSAITINNADLHVTYSTVVDNVSDLDYATIGVFPGADATFTRSILANPGDAPLCYVLFADAESTGYNYLTDTTCGGPAISDIEGTRADLLLRPLANYGGLTTTMLPRADSPVINAVLVADCLAATDQRGAARPVGGACDIGAVERQASDPVDPPLPVPLAFDILDDALNVVASVSVEGAWDYSNVNWWPTAGYAPVVPADTLFPAGIFGFTLNVPEPGDSVIITLELAVPVTQLWKNIELGWFLVGDAVISGTTVVYTITDGGPLDADGAANGVIVDPVAPGSAVGFAG